MPAQTVDGKWEKCGAVPTWAIFPFYRDLRPVIHRVVHTTANAALRVVWATCTVTALVRTYDHETEFGRSLLLLGMPQVLGALLLTNSYLLFPMAFFLVLLAYELKSGKGVDLRWGKFVAKRDRPAAYWGGRHKSCLHFVPAIQGPQLNGAAQFRYFRPEKFGCDKPANSKSSMTSVWAADFSQVQGATGDSTSLLAEAPVEGTAKVRRVPGVPGNSGLV